MLELQNLVWELPDGGSIINGISCKLGSRLTVITGPNGGGKTSLAKLIAGVEKPTSGRILLDGEDITDLDITGRARLGVAYAFQQPVRFKGLTDVMDNVPGIDILDFLPEFLDGLFDMLSDPHREIRQVRFPLSSSLGIRPSSPHASIGNPHVGSGRCEHQLDDRYGDHPNQ